MLPSASLKMRNKGRMPTLTTSIQNVLYILANAVEQENRHTVQKEGSKTAFIHKDGCRKSCGI